jgi:peptide/nickel transport system permease protein
VISRLLLHRLLGGVVTLWIVSVIIFFSVELLPGDVVLQILGQAATEETVEAFRRELGLNRPAIERYAEWILGLAQGDLGTSLTTRQEISSIVWPRLTNTLTLAAFAALLSIPFSIVLGIATALYRHGWLDRIANFVTLTTISFPIFFVAYILIATLSVRLGWFPSSAQMTTAGTVGQKLYLLFLPALSLTLAVFAHMMRMTRASIIGVLSYSYIEMARLKGASPLRLVVVHALPNAIGPIASVVTLNLAFLITGVVIVETVFTYPGMGQLLVDSVARRDLPVVQAACLMFAAIYVALNTLADVISIVSNPRLLHPI